jgi:hypothetical protein
VKQLPLIGAAVFAASGLALMPAVLGLAGNDSFNQRLPVRAPAHASLIVHESRPSGPATVPTIRQPGSRSSTEPRELERADDRGGSRSGADDRRSPDATDDHGADDRGADDRADADADATDDHRADPAGTEDQGPAATDRSGRGRGGPGTDDG